MKFIRLMLGLVFSGVIYPGAYDNTITHIRLILGATRTTMVMTFQKPEPIVTYTPQSYEQSNNATLQHCAYLPKTKIAPNVEMNEYVKAQLSGVTVMIPVLQRKIVAGNKIIFAISK